MNRISFGENLPHKSVMMFSKADEFISLYRLNVKFKDSMLNAGHRKLSFDSKLPDKSRSFKFMLEKTVSLIESNELLFNWIVSM